MRNLHRDRANVFQTGGLHLLSRPRDGAVEGLRAAQTITDPIAEIFKTLKTGLITKRGINEFVGRAFVLRRSLRFCRRERHHHG